MEYGYVFPKGITHVETLVALVEDLQSSLPDSVRIILTQLRRFDPPFRDFCRASD
jgi:2-hydroxy-3-keto-5-methylthiopentenyl-1-phosphate phosphatase